MHHLLDLIYGLVSNQSHWLPEALGGATLLESLPVVGAFVPASVLMLVTGSLLASGVLDPTAVIASCAVGLALGNAISYALGRRVGQRLLRHRVLRRHRRSVARARLLCQRLGPAAICVAPFLGPLRPLTPVLLGAMRMRRRAFQRMNLAAAPLCVMAMLAPGFVLDHGLQHLAWRAPYVAGGVLAYGGLVAALALRGVFARRRARQHAQQTLASA